MLTLRKSEDRGKAEEGWLSSRHTFSFAGYMDRKHMHFRALRVINEDWVAAGEGFDMHPHEDMEIVTYMVEGALEHKDSMGNGGVIRRGEVQRMTAGTGVEHSEFNHSKQDKAHLLQIWIFPAEKGLKPGYEQKAFSEASRKNQLKLVASPTGRDGSVTIHQDASIYCALLEKGASVEQNIQAGRHAWLQLVRGKIELNGQALEAGDGASLSDERSLKIKAGEAAELLFFDLA
jgi:redox-sensitive bicupin YhaK (pirin superfamily)